MNAALRLVILACALLASACEDRDRGGLGPRGTALPPPDPVADNAAPATVTPAQTTPRPGRGR